MPGASLFTWRPFRLLFTTRAASNAANQIQAVAIGWQVYDLTRSPVALGLIGLVQFAPPLLLSLIAGQIVDEQDRRLLLRACYVTEAVVSASLLALSLSGHAAPAPIFLLLFLNGVARSFETPCLQSLLPAMAPPDMLGAAVAAHASASKISQLAGPALGGFLYVWGAGADYSVCAGLIGLAACASWLLPDAGRASVPTRLGARRLTAGLAVVVSNRVLLGVMSLDLIVTLFGGVTALLPIFARDLLHIGPQGFGLLRSAPAVGALIVAGFCARRPLRRRGALVLFSGLLVYALATFLFGVSRSAEFSFIALFAVGAGDMLSTVVRQTLIQTHAPDEARGRVYALSSLFVGTGSQLGQFEFGVTAAWFGAVGSVVFGAAAVLVSALLWPFLFPQIRAIDQLDGPVETRRPVESPKAA